MNETEYKKLQERRRKLGEELAVIDSQIRQSQDDLAHRESVAKETYGTSNLESLQRKLKTLEERRDKYGARANDILSQLEVEK